MDSDVSGLPPGFVEDGPPAGFVEDSPQPPPVTQEGSTGKAKAGGGVSRGDELFQPDPSPAPLLEGDVTGGAMPAGSHAQAATDAVAQGKRAGLDANPFKDDWIAQEVVNGVVTGGAGKIASAAAKGLGRGAVRLAETGKVGNAVEKVAGATEKIRHAASAGGMFGMFGGHSHGAIPIAIDAAVTAAPKVTRALERGVVKAGKLVSRTGVPEATILDQAKLATELRTAEQHIAERKAIDEAKDLTKDAFDQRLSQSERYAATKRAFEKLGQLGNEDHVMGVGKSGERPDVTQVDDPRKAASRAFESLLGAQ